MVWHLVYTIGGILKKDPDLGQDVTNLITMVFKTIHINFNVKRDHGISSMIVLYQKDRLPVRSGQISLELHTEMRKTPNFTTEVFVQTCKFLAREQQLEVITHERDIKDDIIIS
jgi:hypothetical protein